MERGLTERLWVVDTVYCIVVFGHRKSPPVPDIPAWGVSCSYGALKGYLQGFLWGALSGLKFTSS